MFTFISVSTKKKKYYYYVMYNKYIHALTFVKSVIIYIYDKLQNGYTNNRIDKKHIIIIMV